MATEISNAYALVIGIANYKNVNELPSSILQDAKDIRKILIDPFCCGYSSGNVQLLLDSQATKTAICQELTYLAERTDADSTVLLYVSGHGGRIESGRFAGQYLLPVETGVEVEVETFQRFGGVDGRPADAQGQLLLGTSFYLVFQQASQELDIGPLAFNGLLVANVQRLKNARQAQAFQEGNELVRHLHDTPPIRWPTSSLADRTKATAGGGDSTLGSPFASRPCSRIRLTVM